MIYLTNSIPNTFLTHWDQTKVTKLSPWMALNILTYEDQYADYDDNVLPRMFDNNVVVAIGHEVHAQRVSQIFTKLNGFYGFKPIPFNVPCERKQIELQQGDKVVAAIVTTPGRLPEGKMWSAEELESFPIEFLLIEELFIDQPKY